jgi:hypothetical protein
MSTKNIEVQLRKLGMKNDVAGLEAFVSSVEDEKVIISPVVASVNNWHVSHMKNARRLKL